MQFSKYFFQLFIHDIYDLFFVYFLSLLYLLFLFIKLILQNNFIVTVLSLFIGEVIDIYSHWN